MVAKVESSRPRFVPLAGHRFGRLLTGAILVPGWRIQALGKIVSVVGYGYGQYF